MIEMMEYVISGVALGLPFGGFIGIMFCSLASTKIGKIIAVVLSIVIATLGFTFITKLENEKWNDGYCPNCEVHWELRGARKSSKIYVCPKCYKEIIK